MYQVENGDVINVEELTWGDARVILKQYHPELVKMIDLVSLNYELPLLYKAIYKFGTNIIKNSQLYLPLNNGGNISFNDKNLPQVLFDNLNYIDNSSKNNNPLGVIISRNCEFYSENDGVVTSHQVLKSGDFFGLEHDPLGSVLSSVNSEPNLVQDLMAGARSIFILPSIGDNVHHNKLKKFCDITTPVPQSYEQHFTVFKDLALQKESPWQVEILYFSSRWLNIIQEQKFGKVRSYLITRYNSHYQKFSALESILKNISQKKGLDKYPDYILQAALKIFNIASGTMSGFRPAINDDLAPVQLIQDVYLKIYGLQNKYWPIIMEPAQFVISNSDAVYFSLKYAIFKHYTYKDDPSRRIGISNILIDLKNILDKFISGFLDPENGYKNTLTTLYEIIAKICFEYYHDDIPPYKIYNSLKNNINLIKDDERFYCEKIEFFPKNSLFLKGCIKISQKS